MTSPVIFEAGSIVRFEPKEENHLVGWRFPMRDRNRKDIHNYAPIVRAGLLKKGQTFMVMGMSGTSLLALIEGLMVEIPCPIDIVVVSKV